jgi:hypothetical protein
VADPQVIVRYTADLSRLQAANAKAAGSTSKAGGMMRKGLVPAGIALAAVATYSKKATDAASGLNEQIDASVVIFGKSAAGMKDWGATLAESAGLSTRQGLQAANAYGNMFTTMGVGQKAAAGMSKEMVQLAGDMASFNDQDPQVMLDGLRSALSGESEPLKRFGANITEARVKQFAYQEGIAKVGKELTEGQKLQARYGLIMKDTAKQSGTFADTADSVANKQRTLAAQNENVSATFGQALLPAMQAFQSIAQSVFGFLGKYPGLMKVLAAIIVVVAAAVMIANAAMAIAAVVTAAWLLPVLAVIAGIAALIAVGYLLYRFWPQISAAAARAWSRIKGAVMSAFNWIRRNWPLLLPILLGPIGVAAMLIVKNWSKIKDGIQAAVDFVKKQFDRLVGIVRGVVGKIRSAAQAIADAIKAPLNAVIGAWNALRIPGMSLNINMPGPVPDIDFSWGGYDFPDIPRLAHGGIVTSPTVAMVGEAGPEAVVPLSGAGGGIEVRVFIGDTELRGIVQHEVTRNNSATARLLMAGRS